MFLLVFVTLVISILGLYAQILGLQTNKLNHSQYGFMQTMLTWHGSAVSLAKSAALVGPCQLNVQAPLATIPICPPPYLTQGYFLPGDYQINYYTFYSVVFQNASTNYLVTYVAPAGNNVAANIVLPGVGSIVPPASDTGYSYNSLMQQFASGARLGTTWGTVDAAGTLTVQSKTIGVLGNDLTYTLPPSAAIPANSIAVVSPLS